ncbi:MAG: low molecular weight phosphotyrosine protein phosphatase [Thiothrix sp.]|nr:low molecular weight phosphotyrosine protein phosphatase [Thiothrix sp.]HPE61687.1 low molecular weight protein-tyrosine-phosphatase [Thiolinea sp.]
MEKVNVLFVCMGNICRSPTAQGVFTRLVRTRVLQTRIQTDSAGTHAYHIGEPPDKRSRTAALERGIDLSRLRARQVMATDFDTFQYILAMDRNNLAHLLAMAPPERHGRISLFMEHASRWDVEEVPDPYYGGVQGFARVLDMVEDAAEGLLAHIQARHF